MRTSERQDELYAALSKARAGFGAVAKNGLAKIRSEKGNYEYNYATLDECFNAIDEALSANGLAVVGGIEYTDDAHLVVLTRLTHSSGQWLENPIDCGIPKGIKEAGSLITYARRYGLCLTVGIQGEDDDDGERGETTLAESKTRSRLRLDPKNAYTTRGHRSPGAGASNLTPAPSEASSDDGLDVEKPAGNKASEPSVTAGLDEVMTYQNRGKPASPTTAVASQVSIKGTGDIKILAPAPAEKLNHEEAYMACLDELQRLAGDGKDATSKEDRKAYMTMAHGSAIDTEGKMYQLGKSPLLNGLARLRSYRREHPPAITTVGSVSQVFSTSTAGPEEAVADGQTTGDFEHGSQSPQDQRSGSAAILRSSEDVTMPGDPIITEEGDGKGYVSQNDARHLKEWARSVSQASCFDEMTVMCRRSGDNIYITRALFEQIRNAVQYRIAHQVHSEEGRDG